MSDSYQAIFDAVRSRIGSVDIGAAAERAFDISWQKSQLQAAIQCVQNSLERPSVLFGPKISRDGDKWFVLYGENLIDGVAGFGDTPELAMQDFDKNWWNERAAPAAKK